MHSIRFKITTVTIAAVLTSVLALGVIGIYMMGIENDDNSVEKLSLISENIRGNIDAYLKSLIQSMETGIHIADDSLSDLSIDLPGSSDSPERIKKLDAILAEHSAEVEHAFTAIAKNTKGIATYYYCINADLGSSEHGFFWSNLGNDTFIRQSDLISTDLDINDYEHTAWYYSPLKAGRPVWVGPYNARDLGDLLTISYVAPIYRHGFLIGVLGMDIMFDTIVAQISSVKDYDIDTVMLLDKNGRLLYHPEFPIGSVPDVILNNDVDPNLFRRTNSGNTMIRYTFNGEERQMAFSTLSNGMKVVVSVPISKINATQRQMTLIFALVAAVILILYTVFILLITHAITQPLVRLTAASQKLADGDYDVALDYRAKDEVGMLTEAFSRMRDHLQLYISDLNSRAFSDALTGAKNKGAFDIMLTRLNDSIRLGGEEKAPEFGFVMLDCNDLKPINDENGHMYGDMYLQNVCSLISRAFVHSPVFRMGGDEFSVLLQKEDYQNRDELLAEFDRMVEQNNASAAEAWEKVSISKGIAIFDPKIDRDAEHVCQRADDRMYENKRNYKERAVSS